eukprot:1238643-Rhodomonas_salina.1
MVCRLTGDTGCPFVQQSGTIHDMYPGYSYRLHELHVTSHDLVKFHAMHFHELIVLLLPVHASPNKAHPHS